MPQKFDGASYRRPAGYFNGQNVNDRPYEASSFLSVAIAEVFGSALPGESKERPELVDAPLPLRVTLSALLCRGRLSEVDKLLRHGEGWLPTHPECETITRRYLKHQRKPMTGYTKTAGRPFR